MYTYVRMSLNRLEKAELSRESGVSCFGISERIRKRGTNISTERNNGFPGRSRLGPHVRTRGASASSAGPASSRADRSRGSGRKDGSAEERAERGSGEKTKERRIVKSTCSAGAECANALQVVPAASSRAFIKDFRLFVADRASACTLLCLAATKHARNPPGSRLEYRSLYAHIV